MRSLHVNKYAIFDLRYCWRILRLALSPELHVIAGIKGKQPLRLKNYIMSGYPPPSGQAYPPPYPGYPQAPQQSAQTTVVFAQPVVAQTVLFRDRPVVVTDSNGQQVQTVLEYRNGTLMWVAFLVACLFVGILAFVVFFFNDLKDVYHITPTDGKVVGVYKRLG